MNYLLITGNPKSEGLCHTIEKQVQQGASDGGANVEILQVDKLNRCRVCGDGWGVCYDQNRCILGADGFDEAQERVKNADQICIITPVYWQEMAEGLKCFLDRLRRCEFGENGILAGKQVLLIASPGGSGNGMVACLEDMERFCRHTGALVFDYIGVNRWNHDYKQLAAYAAARAMAQGRKMGESI